MPSAKPVLLLLLGTALLAVVGALFGSAWATGIGVIVTLGIVAVHPAVTDPAVPRPTRLLLRGGLLLLTLAVVVEVWGWAASPFGDTPPSTSELLALVTDPARQRTQFLRQLATASCLVLSCACLGAAIGRLPRQQLRRFGVAAPTVGALTLVSLAFVALLPSGLTALLGSFTNVAVAALLVFGGFAWVVGRAVRQYGTASIAAVGATVLAAATWFAVDSSWRSRPEPRDSNVFYQEGVNVAVAVETRPDVENAVAVAAILLGATLTVLACARLSTTESETR
jgi:hypothetical protein